MTVPRKWPVARMLLVGGRLLIIRLPFTRPLPNRYAMRIAANRVRKEKLMQVHKLLPYGRGVLFKIRLQHGRLKEIERINNR